MEKEVNSSTERSRKSREKMKKNPEKYQEIILPLARRVYRTTPQVLTTQLSETLL